MSRRLDISSLLCDDHRHPPPPLTPSHVPDPVVLAPHLTRHDPLHHPPPSTPIPIPLPPTDMPAPPHPLRRSLYDSDADPPRQDIPRQDLSRPDPPRPFHSPSNSLPPRSIDSLVHPSYQQRPSSSSSPFSTRSPRMPHPSHLPPSFPSSPIQQRFPPPPRHSPLLHRPPSSHSQTPYFPAPPLPPPSSSSSSPSSSTSPPKLAGLEALVQAATQERRRLSGGIPDPDLPPSSAPPPPSSSSSSSSSTARSPLLDESHHRRTLPIDIKRSPQQYHHHHPRHHRSQERLVDDPYPRSSLNPSPSAPTPTVLPSPSDDFTLRAASFPQSHHPPRYDKDRSRPHADEPRFSLSPVDTRYAFRTYDDDPDRQRYDHRIPQSDVDHQRRHHEQLLRQEQKLQQQQQRLDHQQRLEQRARDQHIRDQQQAQRDHDLLRAQEAELKRAEEMKRAEALRLAEEMKRAEVLRLAEESKRAEERHRLEIQLEREREQRLEEERERRRQEEMRLREQRIQEQQRQQAEREQRLQEERELQRQQEQREKQRQQDQRELQRQQEVKEQRERQLRFLEQQRDTAKIAADHLGRESLPPSVSSPVETTLPHTRKTEIRQIIRSEPSKRPSPPPPPSAAPAMVHPPHDGMRPSKKPRYSQSPSRPESTTPSPPEDKEREFFSRDPPSDIGLGRPESIFHHTPVSASSAGPRRPGSGTGRRAMAVSDLVSSTDKERSIASANLQSSHDRPSLRVVSPLGRRSPPGSLAGRAIAARKTDDSTVSMMVVEKKEPVTVSIPPPPPPPPREYSAPTQIVIPESEPRLPEPVKKVKEEPVALKAPPREVRPPPPPPQPPVVDSIPKKSKDKSHPPKEVKDHPRPRPTPKEQQKAEDAHDWLLEHYAREPSPEPSPRPEPPHSPSPSISPIVAASPSRPSMSALAEHQSSSPEPKKRSPSPLRTATPPAEAAIEELEELVAETEAEIIPKTTIVNKQEPLDVDMDLDELVAETLNGGEDNAGKRQEEEEEEEGDVRMEVDVEDELLSLVGDRPPPPPRRAVSGSSTSVPPHPAKPTPLRMNTDVERQASPPAVSSLSAPTPSTITSPAIPRPSSARPASDRGSMPPPATTPGVPRAKEKEKEDTGKKGERAGSVSSSVIPAKKKKEVTASKAPAKAKITTGDKGPKARSKAPPKAKKTTEVSSPAALPMKTSKSGSGPGGKKNTSASRSRSASVMPGGSVGPEGDAQADKQDEDDSDAANDDDKLYCVCKTKYDEDKFMIACDRCDEWYHTQCVNLPELEVDLIDQFICPPCIDKNPHLSLKTTYKPRCLYGLKQPDPSSPKACHKPARGAFSKYCSDECGVKYMESRIEAYAKKGGKKDKLWESVKNAEKREGVVVCAENALNGHIKMDVDVPKDGDVKPLSSKRSKVARETDRLKGSLEQIVKRREELKKGMEIVIWREKLLELASERAQQLGLCGWDHRLCFSDEELADYGAGVLESYEEIKLDGVKEENGDMQIDGAVENQGEWWCPGNVSCGRHVGWQLTRYKDVCKEKEKKEEALMKLTTREREIRKHIEDIVDPHGRNTNEASPQSPLKPANTKLSNGHSKVKLGDGVKKGKKRKAPAS